MFFFFFWVLPQELEAKNGKISVDIFCKVAGFLKTVGLAGLVESCPILNRGQWKLEGFSDISKSPF